MVELDPYASEIVKMIFKLAGEGIKLPKIADVLNEMWDIPRAKYQYEVLKMESNHLQHLADKWNSSMVWDIVTDLEYCGYSVNLTY